jgi:hypothetical protein
MVAGVGFEPTPFGLACNPQAIVPGVNCQSIRTKIPAIPSLSRSVLDVPGFPN